MNVLRKHRNDILLILALLLLAGGVWAALRLTRQSGGEVVVTVDGVETARLPLDRNGSYTWTGAGGSNTLVVRDGQAHMETADCPDKLCISQGSIRWDGESIVCLPHRLVATVTGGQKSGLDAVAR